MKNPRTTKLDSSEWSDILVAIPGYDPFATSGECWFDLAEAQRCVGFFESCLSHAKGEKAGGAFTLERWQKAILGNLFGWKRQDGRRRYREALIYIPRKNGKTLLASGIGNYMLFGDGEKGAEIYCAASDREQASLLFDVARQQVLNEPVLKRLATVYQKSITIEKTGSVFKAISADAASAHGYNGHCVIIDELHAQPTRELVDVLMTSTGARTQPLVVHLTTADYVHPSICNEKYDYACKVRDGVVKDEGFLPVVYEATKDEDWTSPEVWRKANPNLGVSITEEYLARECARARETPSYENTFKRLHLNLRTEQDVRWLPLDAWDLCGSYAVSADELRGKPAYMGIDLSSNKDVTAVVLVVPAHGGFYVLPEFFVPMDTAQQRERKDRVPYETWIRRGLVHGTPGNVVDHDYVRARVNKLADEWDVREVAIDPWNATQLSTQLQQDGFEVVAFRQGMASMSGPSKELEKLILQQRLWHGGNEVLRWMASNVMAELDAAGNIKPSKKKSAEKIDGIVALIMALGRATLQKETQSVYATRGVTIL